MKRSLIYLSSAVALLIAAVSLVGPHKTFAYSTGDSHAHAVIKLAGTNTPQSITPSGKMGNGTSIAFSYDSGAKSWISAPIPGAGSCDGSQGAKNNLTLTVTARNAASDAVFTGFCNSSTAVETKTITIRSSSAPRPASVSGTIKYKNDDEKLVNIGDAAGTLSGPSGSNSQTRQFSVKDGKFSVTGLAAGRYKLTVDYAVPGGQNQNYTKTFTLAAGESKAINDAVAGNAARAGNGDDPNSDPDADGGGAAEEQLDCDASESPLSWIICPVIDTLASMIDGLDHLITQYMEVDTAKIFDGSSDTSKAYHDAWQSFRNIALGLMIIAGLVIVMSQALGMEILDAYTIRKTLPRLLIAAIGISLSWPLMHFLIDASNWLGFGIRRLIYFPFTQNGLDTTIDLNFGGGIGNILIGTGALAVTGVATGAWLLVGGLGVILSLAASGALAVIIAILVLVLRQIAIIVLMLVAPIAIICFALPNTQKFYKFWWESFSKALLMFPLIAAFIATGRVFAAISFSNKGDPISQLIGFVSYIAPYFLIPLTFRFAGGFVRQLGGFVNDRSRGGFDRLKKQRSAAYQKNWGDVKAGTRVKGKSYIPGSFKAADAINTVGKSVGSGWNGRYGFGERGARARAHIDQIAGMNAAKSEEMQSISGFNDANRLLAMGMGDERRGRESLVNYLRSGGDEGVPGSISEDEIQRRTDVAMAAARVAGGFTRANGVAAFYSMANDGTAIRDTDDLAALSASVGGGDYGNTYKYAAEGASISRRAGRSDLAAASGAIAPLAFDYANERYNQNFDVGGRPRDQLSAVARASGIGGEVAQAKLSQAKGRTVRNDVRNAVDVMRGHREAIESGQASPYTQEQVQHAAASLVDMKQAVDSSYGRLDNRVDAQREMDRDDGALDWYLDTASTVEDTQWVGSNIADRTPIYRAENADVTNRQIVNQIVGERYASPETRRMLEQQGGGGAPQPPPDPEGQH